MSMKNPVLGLLGLALLALSCAGGPAAAPAKPASGLSGPLVSPNFPSASGLSDYAKEGLSSLSTFSLSNGIPVVLRRNPASPVRHLSLVLRGGSAAATLETAGWELLALRTMARAGTKYDYKTIQDLLDSSSASMGAGATLDYSSYSLTSLDKYFPLLLPIWANTLVSPAFAQEDFDQVLSDSKLALQSREKDPWQRTGLAMNAEFFAGHPYAPPAEGTKASLEAASLEAVKAWYATKFSADRIFVVASGDFDPGALQKDLEAALGGIADRKAGPGAKPPRFSPAPASRLVKAEYAPTKGVAYVRGDFAAPSPADPDFMATNLAMKMFSDLLFNVVRDKHGAVYSPSAYIRSFAANYGSITLFKTNVPGKIKAYVDEAAAEFAAGKVLATGAEASGHGAAAAKDTAPRTTIEEALEVYKAQYVNAYFEKLQTNSAVAGLIAQSVVSTGDCRSWLLDRDRINAVTAEGVRAAAAKYLFGQGITWVVLSSKDGLVPVVSADYEKLGK